MDSKKDLHVQKGPHHGIHNIHPMEQKGDTFPSLRHKIQAYQDDQRSEKVLQWDNTFQFSALTVTHNNPRKSAPGKIRARWSNKSRHNPMITRRPNTPDAPVTNMDTADMDKMKMPLSVIVCNRFRLICQFCKQNVMHPSPQESDWSDKNWTGGTNKITKASRGDQPSVRLGLVATPI